ncbi:Putative amino-acid ABC transporter-binding protein YhdW [bacterium HR39]|nr:Putative amino-acid ABC transporter-binding protein YhdW [bacterium HR39]
MRITTLALAGAFALAGIGTAAAASPTLEAVKKNGFVRCGVNASGLPGFATVDDQGNWSGFDVDFCKAVAAAIFGDASKVKYVPLSAKERFTALQSGEIDVLIRNTTWTLARDTALGLDFVGVNYYDGQGFMVPKALGVKSALELDGASVCVQTGTTTERNLADYFRKHNMKYEPVVFESSNEAIAAFQAGRCDVFTTDRSGLYAERTRFSNPDDWVILPEVISKEPLGPVVRHGDNEWGDIVRWVFYATLEAEEYGVTSGNVDELRANSDDPAVRRLLGVEEKFGEYLGLPQDWAYQVIKQVGNYGEIFERNLGMGTPLGIERGLNDLWTRGGLQYAMPFR